MQITFLARKSALIYRRGLRQRVASLTIDCNGVFAIRAYRPLSRRLDRCDRVIHNESGDPNGGNFVFVFRSDVYVTMQITFLTRKSALIYRRGLRQRVASLILNCNGDFAIRAYRHDLVTGIFFSEVSLAERIQSSKRFKRQPNTVNGLLRKKVQSKAVTIRANKCTVLCERWCIAMYNRKGIKTRLQKANRRSRGDCSVINWNLES